MMEIITDTICAAIVAMAAPAASSFKTPTSSKSPMMFTTQAMPTKRNGKLAFPTPRKTPLITL